jgi:hypothetical protein
MSPGFCLRQHVVPKAQLIERAAAVVLGEHIGIANEPQQHVAPLGVLEVERDPALVAIHHQERRGHAVDPRLAVAARFVAAGDLLDLDDVGAHVREHHSARRAGHDLRELEHAHAGERAGAGRGSADGHSWDPPCPAAADAKARVHRQRPTKSGLRFARNAA